MPPSDRICPMVPKKRQSSQQPKLHTLSHLTKSRFFLFHSKLTHHTNPLIKRLSSRAIPDNPQKRLKRSWPRDLLAWPVGWYYRVPSQSVIFTAISLNKIIYCTKLCITYNYSFNNKKMLSIISSILQYYYVDVLNRIYYIHYILKTVNFFMCILISTLIVWFVIYLLYFFY